MALGKGPDYNWIDPEMIAQWTSEGHWPPPQGVILVQEIKPDPKALEEGLHNLINILPANQREIVQKALTKLQS